MNINRHNYETIFLLYTDNELSASEKKAVEDFVRSNPDLEEELLMLQQSVCKPEQVVFFDKSSLIRREPLSPTVQEKLLLHLDDELNSADQIETAALIHSNEAIEKEWKLLQQTKIHPETVVFEDKQSLYRKEAARVVGMSFPWKRLAVAAVFIGFGSWGVFRMMDKTDTKLDTATAVEIKNTPAPAAKAMPGQEQPADTAALFNDRVKNKGAVELADATTSTNVQIVDQTSLKTKPASNSNETDRVKSSEEKISIAKKNDINVIKDPYSENLNNSGSNKNIIASVKPEKQPNAIVNNGNNDLANNTVQQGPANVYASNTAFTDNDEENFNRVLFMDEEKIKRTKLGGIFKKVKRVFERNANINPGGNNIKVANLEFAIQ